MISTFPGQFNYLERFTIIKDLFTINDLFIFKPPNRNTTSKSRKLSQRLHYFKKDNLIKMGGTN